MEGLKQLIVREFPHAVWGPAGIFFCLFMNILLAVLGLTGNSADSVLTAAFADTYVLLLLIETIGAPLLEEYIFRGLIFGKLRLRTGPVPAALLSAVLFALLHFGPVKSLYAFVFGLVLCYFYHWTGSVFCCFLIHALANLTAILVSLIPAVSAFAGSFKIPLMAAGFIGLVLLMFLVRNRVKGAHGSPGNR